jgi:hypothetical protein
MNRFRTSTIAACHRSAFAEPVKEWAPTYTLDKQIAEARKAMGEERWQQLNEEWNA